MQKKVSVLVYILIGAISALIFTSCGPNPPPTPLQITLPVRPTVAEIPTDTPEPTEAISTPEPCPWTPYFFDGEIVSSPDNGVCLQGEKGINVSDDFKNVTFFLSRSSEIGTYGVCRNISAEDELKFKVSIHDNIAASRFLVMINPEPVPTIKNSVGFRIQPEVIGKNEQGMWIKLIEFKTDHYDTDKGGIPAINDWIINDDWTFDFLIQFDGSQGNLSVNKKALSRTWPISFFDRYLCFAYQQMPTPSNASELEVTVSFP